MLYSLQVWREGLRVHFDPDRTITHLAGASSTAEKAPTLGQQQRQLEARYLVQRLGYGRWAERLVRSVDILACRLRLLRCKLRRDTNASEKATRQRQLLEAIQSCATRKLGVGGVMV